MELAPLPYDYKALEPIIGEQTLKIHHGKHHAKYVPRNILRCLLGTPFATSFMHYVNLTIDGRTTELYTIYLIVDAFCNL